MPPWIYWPLRLKLRRLRHLESRAFAYALQTEGPRGDGPAWAEQKALLRELVKLAERLNTRP